MAIVRQNAVTWKYKKSKYLLEWSKRLLTKSTVIFKCHKIKLVWTEQCNSLNINDSSIRIKWQL